MQKNSKISLVMTHRILDDELFELSIKSYIASLKTKYKFELIFVDNESDLQYLDWLARHCDVYIRNAKNLGNGRAWDQGIVASHGDIVILMDNDCVPQVQDWNVEMIDKLDDETIGISFPSSLVGDELDRQEAGLTVNYRARRDGFCFAFRREVYEKVGPFLCDQPFKYGYYEDDWFEYRVQYNLGLRLVGCPTSQVWHRGQATTKKMMQDGIEANRGWYEGKTKGTYPYLSE